MVDIETAVPAARCVRSDLQPVGNAADDRRGHAGWEATFPDLAGYDLTVGVRWEIEDDAEPVLEIVIVSPGGLALVVACITSDSLTGSLNDELRRRDQDERTRAMRVAS